MEARCGRRRGVGVRLGAPCLFGLLAEPVAFVVEAMPLGGEFRAHRPGLGAGLGGGGRGHPETG
ncbi:hypothetical protein ACIBQ1_60860 [Nonomuraea sp. NPDC050153]|uniref:hypothetical protein n=1 Tax=Nonomuraea sp. NPDC050153 TaxID=3364359 RepID=UPI0037A97BC2